MEPPPQVSLLFPLLGPLLAHWSHPSLGRETSPVGDGGGPDSGRAQGSVHSINAFQNYCPLPVRIQEIVVETPALAAERAR